MLGLAVRDQAAALAAGLRRRSCGGRHFPCGSRHAASDTLAAPWPDIVIGIGYRSAPVSRWIGQQAGRVINIRLGRPRTDLKPYDLVITTPQYGLPPAPNVRELPLPLVKADDGAMAKAIARWRSEFERCRRRVSPSCSAVRPSTWRSTMRSPAALARDLQAFAARTGGSLLITSSPRSPAGLKAILRAGALGAAFPVRVPGGQRQSLSRPARPQRCGDRHQRQRLHDRRRRGVRAAAAGLRAALARPLEEAGPGRRHQAPRARAARAAWHGGLGRPIRSTASTTC